MAASVVIELDTTPPEVALIGTERSGSVMHVTIALTEPMVKEATLLIDGFDPIDAIVSGTEIQINVPEGAESGTAVLRLDLEDEVLNRDTVDLLVTLWSGKFELVAVAEQAPALSQTLSRALDIDTALSTDLLATAELDLIASIDVEVETEPGTDADAS